MISVRVVSCLGNVSLKHLPPSHLWSKTLLSTGGYDEVSYDKFQFLEKSDLPTMHFQASLLRLPIPKLEKTLERLARGLQPILSQEQLNELHSCIKRFPDEGGSELHDLLVANDKANEDTSYISESWFDMYLKARTPLVIHYNPFLAIAFDKNEVYNDQLLRATNLTLSILRFKRSLESNVLSPEVFHLNPVSKNNQRMWKLCKILPRKYASFGAFAFKSFPLDMSQYSSLFNSTRIPALEKDQLTKFPLGRHILVIRHGHFFAVECLNSDGSIKNPADIHSALAHILSLPKDSPKYPISVLSTEERSRWAELRVELLKTGNEEALKLVDSAIFVLALDDFKVANPDDPIEREKLVRSFLHGDGTDRWFDKSFTVAIHKDGLTAVNFEHSWGDGVAVLRLVEEVYKDSCENHFVSPDTKVDVRPDAHELVRRIDFKLNSNLQNAITTAQDKFKKLTESLNFATFEYTGMTKDFIKKQKLSPDAVVQLAIQMAYYRLFKGTACTYESCSTAVFRHGRTETVRSATVETKAFCEAFFNSKASKEELRAMIDNCSKTHYQLCKDASKGHGFDRHLFALEDIAQRRGKDKMPSLFNCEAYKLSKSHILSTSTLATNTIILGGFGPVAPNGFGVGYMVSDDKVGCIVSAFNEHRNSASFIRALDESLGDIKGILS